VPRHIFYLPAATALRPELIFNNPDAIWRSFCTAASSSGKALLQQIHHLSGTHAFREADGTEKPAIL
jgi:hypothetical protein